ncbi:hypothetical protein QR680_013126 [Steinernema hermaphroditum]|uniref:Lysosome membrane protein 2 n=1 Tax=Steinernema hermaphroditum TaxID=289476 RepID=A0AA39M1R4_9BILA|nr:hypothetical protein QR680_013126 [Steinernema hermaphroditum]
MGISAAAVVGGKSTSAKKPRRVHRAFHATSLCCIVISAILFIACVAFLVALPQLIEKNVRQLANLAEDSAFLEKWLDPDYEIKSHIWTYSVRNPDEIMNGSIPEVKATGPYVFDQKHHRKIIERKNGTIKYQAFKTYFFNESDSCDICFLGNHVWVPNLVYQKFVEAASKPAMKAAATALVSQTPFLEVDVSELLFDGYIDPFLDQVCDIPFMGFVCETILDLPERIGFFFKQNGTSEGTYLIDNGVSNSARNFGKILTFNDEKAIPSSTWSSPLATVINGTDGSVFHPYIEKDERLEVFVPSLCRSIYLIFEKEVEYEGILAYRFVMPAEVLNSSLSENRIFCNSNDKSYFSDDKEDCLPAGLLDISRCQKGEPTIVFSLPNFLFADQKVKDSIRGVNVSDATRDQVTVDIEPRLGVILRANRASQINVAMWRGKGIQFPVDLTQFKSSIVPVVTTYETATVDPETLQMIQERLIKTEKIATVSSYVGIALALIFALLAGVVLLYLTGKLEYLLCREMAPFASDSVSPLPNGRSKDSEL